MVSINIRNRATVSTLLLAAFPPVGLVVSTARPVLAQTSGTWIETGTLNTSRNGHTATLLPSGEVLVVGGESSSGTILTSAERYNLASGKWTNTGSTAIPRVDHTATLLANGEVLVSGFALAPRQNTSYASSRIAQVLDVGCLWRDRP